LATLASAIPAMWASKLKMCHVTLTTPILGVVCHPKARNWYSLCAKFDDSSFSRSQYLK